MKRECILCENQATTSREGEIMTFWLCETCAICMDEVRAKEEYVLSDKEKELLKIVTNLSI